MSSGPVSRTSPGSVCVYCGKSVPNNEMYKQIAREVGTALAKRHIKMIYGGCRIGMMGLTADAALAAGGEVIGIIPELIRNHEVAHTGLTQLHVVDSMHTRKRMMVELSEAFVILPGGFGTLDEAFEILSWKKLGLHNKPVVIYNPNGFWTPLLDLIAHMKLYGFVTGRDTQSFAVAKNLDDMFEALAAPPGPPIDPATMCF